MFNKLSNWLRGTAVNNMDAGFIAPVDYSKPLNEIVKGFNEEYHSTIRQSLLFALQDNLHQVAKTSMFLGNVETVGTDGVVKLDISETEIKGDPFKTLTVLVGQLTKLLGKSDEAVDFTGVEFVVNTEIHFMSGRTTTTLIAPIDGVWARFELVHTTHYETDDRWGLEITLVEGDASFDLHTHYPGGLYGEKAFIKRIVDQGIITGGRVDQFMAIHYPPPIPRVPYPDPLPVLEAFKPITPKRLEVKRFKRRRTQPTRSTYQRHGYSSMYTEFTPNRHGYVPNNTVSNPERRRCDIYHVVRPGDTFARIANEARLTTSELRSLNPVVNYQVGAEVLIAKNVAMPKPYDLRHVNHIAKPRHDKFSSMTDFEVERYIREQDKFHQQQQFEIGKSQFVERQTELIQRQQRKRQLDHSLQLDTGGHPNQPHLRITQGGRRK